MNKQPFYHNAMILFTATEEVDQNELKQIIHKALSSKKWYVKQHNIEIEDFGCDAGDPHDLME